MSDKEKVQSNKLVLFQAKEIRRVWHDQEWWFSVVDIISVLTDSNDPKQYIKRLRQRDLELKSKWGTICTPLQLLAQDGKKRKENCANTQGVLRIVQSIPSPKAEPFKLWLAKVGHERIQEIENPELAQERMKALYEKKGYSKEWIDKRLRGIAIRQNLTDEWKKRGVTSPDDFAILTAEISKATFGMTPSEYRQFKNLPEESKVNLRDHMDDLELIFTMLGERVTTEISEQEKPETFTDNQTVANRGGKVAGNARKETEKELGRAISTSQNFLEGETLQKLDS